MSEASLNAATGALMDAYPTWGPSKCRRVARAVLKRRTDPDKYPPITYLDPTGEEAVWRILRKTA